MYEVRKLHNYKPILIVSIIPSDCIAIFYTLIVAISRFRSTYKFVSILLHLTLNGEDVGSI